MHPNCLPLHHFRRKASSCHGMLAVKSNLSNARFGNAGPVYKYDLSLPTGRMYDLVEVMRDRLRHLPVR
jgi:hypothetical protein